MIGSVLSTRRSGATDAAILTMTANLRHRLLAQRRQLMLRYRDEMERADAHLGERETETVDQATEEWEAAVLARLGETDAQVLEEVVGAIRRLDDGTYGRCRSCEQAISARRLDALPTATMCIECADETSTQPLTVPRQAQNQREI